MPNNTEEEKNGNACFNRDFYRKHFHMGDCVLSHVQGMREQRKAQHSDLLLFFYILLVKTPAAQSLSH